MKEGLIALGKPTKKFCYKRITVRLARQIQILCSLVTGQFDQQRAKDRFNFSPESTNAIYIVLRGDNDSAHVHQRIQTNAFIDDREL